MVSILHPTNADMSQNLFGREDYDYIGKELVLIRRFVDDELIALNLIVEKHSHIRAFKVLRNDRDCKLAYIWMFLHEHERRGGV